ncbi:MAG: hypothetical protein U5J63_14770 [Fodinibius sp.]|nr:hypothetical protein [Fodinibius sp.]
MVVRLFCLNPPARLPPLMVEPLGGLLERCLQARSAMVASETDILMDCPREAEGDQIIGDPQPDLGCFLDQ